MAAVSKLNYTVISSGYAAVNGRELKHESAGAAMLAELYREYIGD